MKNIIRLSVLLIGLSSSAQIVTIPDANFKNALVNHPVADIGNGFNEDVDTNNDGEVQVSEAEAVLLLDVSDFQITSVEGIASFSNIISLYCSNNQITSIDISQNSNLEHFGCSYNSLNELDVSQNLNLRFLGFSFNQVTDIDLSMNVLLEGLGCRDNKLTELDVTQNTALWNLNCQGNQLTELDVSQNPDLFVLYCHFNQLNSLDVSANPALSTLVCGVNNLTSLDLTQNPSIFYLFCGSNKIKELDLTQNDNLGVFSCRSMETLTHLDLRNGNNAYIGTMWADETPNLRCILVDDDDYANAQDCNYSIDGWCKDVNDLFIEDMSDCVLGIGQNLATNISVFPNPVGNILNIQTEIDGNIKLVQVYDHLGRLLLNESIITDQIDLSILDSGIFFLKVIINEGVYTSKLIKE